TQALDEFRAAITTAGGIIEDFLAWNSYIIRIPTASSRELIAALPCVRWVGDFHPGYRLEPSIREPLFDHGAPPPLPQFPSYNVQVFEGGLGQRSVVASRIEQIGGEHDNLFEDGFRFLTSLTPSQLLQVIRMDEVEFVDVWTGVQSSPWHGTSSFGVVFGD